MADRQHSESTEKMLIRIADIEDSSDVLDWRNDPVTRSMAINPDSIGAKEHLEWFKRCLIDPMRKMYIGIVDERKVGICRFDIDPVNKKALVSINLNPHMRGMGLSHGLLSGSINEFNRKNSIVLSAVIRKENTASIRIFQRCGFSMVAEDAHFLHFEGGNFD